MASFLDILDEVMEDPNVQKALKNIDGTMGRFEKKMAQDPDLAGKAFEIGGIKKELDMLKQSISRIDTESEQIRKQEELKRQKEAEGQAAATGKPQTSVTPSSTGVGSDTSPYTPSSNNRPKSMIGLKQLLLKKKKLTK